MSVGLESFRDLLSEAATWQTLCGATGSAEEKQQSALAHIYRYGLENWENFPFVVISEEAEDTEAVGWGDGVTFVERGQVLARLWMEFDEDDWDSADAAVRETMTSLVDDLWALSSRDGRLIMNRVSKSAPTRMSVRNRKQDVMLIELRVDWGPT